MAEGLRKIPQQHLGLRFDLLGEKAQMVRGLSVRHEDTLRLIDLSGHCKNLGQPEPTEDEGPLLPTDAVVASVAMYVGALAQFALNPLYGSIAPPCRFSTAGSTGSTPDQPPS